MLNNFFSKDKSDLDGYNFKKQIEKDPLSAVILDVRTPAEFAEASIPGALNIDILATDFKSRIQELDPGKSYYVYCSSGNRSGNAVGQMAKIGLTAFNLIGGISACPK
ncbi:rhodanese-like domain-containing protein [Mucilaginibacter sp. 10I4]|uniref:rhodanese-like domain-containing protein n=1 Tax=Mucilaginibacter sp. 10I4 TaxID=3048580 RepID=UPI002B22500F|nr:rhodanese-like domain-containing protein [Mucilaginibacter sp. 10I4]MEB0260720.1 rhodanese-like domain-containing protein [Mucilaginibacter sp. 10I4]